MFRDECTYQVMTHSIKVRRLRVLWVKDRRLKMSRHLGFIHHIVDKMRENRVITRNDQCLVETRWIGNALDNKVRVVQLIIGSQFLQRLQKKIIL